MGAACPARIEHVSRRRRIDHRQVCISVRSTWSTSARLRAEFIGEQDVRDLQDATADLPRRFGEQMPGRPP